MLRQWLRWKPFYTFSKKIAGKSVKKCQLKKKLKDGFKQHLLEHVDSYKAGLNSESLKYAIWFGHNMSLANPADQMLFKDIKYAIRRNITQLDNQLCMMASDMFSNYKCTGDEEDIIDRLKKYVEENIDEFDQKDLKKFEDNLYLINQESMPFAKLTPKLQPRMQQESFAKKQIKKLGIDTSQFQYNFTSNNYKLTLAAGDKVLRMVGIEHSVDWIESMRRQLYKCQGVIMELVPFYHEEETKHTPQQDSDAKLRRLMGTIKGVPQNVVEKRINTPFIVRDVKSYLKHFPSNGSLIVHKNPEDKDSNEVDELRSLLKHLPTTVDSVLLADVAIEEEILELARRYTLEEIREFYAFSRLLFINEQGRYLQQVSKLGCPQCGGSAQLLSPMNIADGNYYPLEIRDKLIAGNIHHYMKSTNYKSYSCFVGESHVFPLFKQLSLLYNKDGGWKVDRQLSNLSTLRPQYRSTSQTEEQLEHEVNKIALLSSLYPRGLNKLPLELAKMQPLHDKLLDNYRQLLHPFQLHCRE